MHLLNSRTVYLLKLNFDPSVHSLFPKNVLGPNLSFGFAFPALFLPQRWSWNTKQKLTERTDSRQRQTDLCWRAKSSATQALPLLLQELSQAVEGGQLPVNILPLKTEQESVREEEGREERRREEESHRLLLQNPC